MTDRGRVLAILVGAALLGIAAVFAFRTPPAPSRPGPGILASPGVAPGRAGGLLPDVVLRGRVRTTPARELRPGIVMLVRAHCDCETALRQVVSAAAGHRLVTYVVEAGDSLAQVELLAARAGGDVGPYADPTAALATAYRLRSAAALVLVRRDGVVTQVIDAISPALRLDVALRALV